MSDIAIKVENLGKSYLVGHNSEQAERNPTLRDVITRNAKNFVRKTSDMLSGRQIVQGDEVEEFWALKHVNFEIKQGDRVGIIGRNGAGKSTLLKLLSRITEPTTGRVSINGRVASLLEVGTGFHPELTGRENIFLNGAILGMSRREIQRKFDEIVSFAEIEKFLDTPVKRYSSGMYVRLAFAVAAHLEPEILIVDEVLAVGDAQFQRKCLGKMQEVGQDGRTVIFVSHNMTAINQLCESAVMLTDGEISFIGKTQTAIERYLKNSNDLPNPADLTNVARKGGDSQVRFNSICILSELKKPSKHFSIGENILFKIGYNFSTKLNSQAISIEIKTDDGTPISNIVNIDSGYNLPSEPGSYSIEIRIDDIRLYPGRYTIGIWTGSRDGNDTYDYIDSGLSFEIIDGGKLTTRSLPRTTGFLFLTPEWSIKSSIE